MKSEKLYRARDFIYYIRTNDGGHDVIVLWFPCKSMQIRFRLPIKNNNNNMQDI